MGVFGKSAPKRLVVKQYGRDSMLFAAVNPVTSAFMIGVLGMKPPVREEQLALAMEKDAVAMRQQGYRIASDEEYKLPLFGVTYHKVTYELIDAPP
jgi:chromosome segregation and condensation protein ScpB